VVIISAWRGRRNTKSEKSVLSIGKYLTKIYLDYKKHTWIVKPTLCFYKGLDFVLKYYPIIFFGLFFTVLRFKISLSVVTVKYLKFFLKILSVWIFKKSSRDSLYHRFSESSFSEGKDGFSRCHHFNGNDSKVFFSRKNKSKRVLHESYELISVPSPRKYYIF